MSADVRNDTTSAMILSFYLILYRLAKSKYSSWGRILVQVTIYRRLLIGRDGHLDQSEAYDIS